MHKLFRSCLSIVLAVATLTTISVTVAPPANAAITDKCDGTSTQNLVTVTASHGKVFYIDSGQNQNVDASYVGYKIAVTGAKTNVYANLDTFTGNVVSLANKADANMPMGNMSSNTSKTAFFLLKASTSSTTSQSHVVRIFSGLPNATGSSLLYSCTFTFTKVSETIKAAANKVTGISSTSTNVLGSTMTITVDGDCGTVGNGTTLDGDMIWISPASRSSWPTSALRLTSTRLQIDDVSNLGSTFYDQNDNLQVTALRTKIGGNPYKCYYRATYTFTIIGSTPAAISVAPIAQISSGTQIKHTDMSNIPSTSLNTNTVTVNASVSKSVSATTSQTSSKTNVNYTLTLTNSNATNPVTFDQVVDTPSSGIAYLAGSARLATLATAEPVTDSSGRLIFSQPITVNANSSVALTYTMQEVAACTTGQTITYLNSAIARIGSIQLGSNATSYSVTTASGTCGTSTLTTTTTTQTQFAVEVITYPATAILNTSATLNGTVDPNSLSGQTVSFVYGTSSTLSSSTTTVNLGSTTTTGTEAYGVSTSVTGLTAGTVYYFRVKVGSVLGEIKSFVTTEPVANPTATTTNVSGVTAVSAGGGTFTVTFNGSIDPNQVAGGAGAKFEYAVDGSQSLRNCATRETVGAGSISVYELDEAGLVPNSNPTLLNLPGSFPVDVFATQEGLTKSKFYCYRVIATYSTSSTASGAWVSFYTGTFNSQTITFNQIATQSTTSTYTLGATASSTLSVTYVSGTPDVCTISGTTVTFLIGGICSITALQGGNFEYYPAESVTVNFLVTAPDITITFNNNGGSGTMTSQTQNTPTAIKANTFTRTGYTFVGWSLTDTGGVAYEDLATYNFSVADEFFAVWSANTYSITYKAGTDGVGADVIQNFTFGTTATLYTNVDTSFTRSGKVVTGWNEVIGGTGTARAFSSTYSSAANLIVFAQWGNAFTVTFNANGGSGSATVGSVTQTTVGGSVTLTTVGSLTKANSGFLGWGALTTASSALLAPSSAYTPSSTLSVYAQWITTLAASSVSTTSATINGESSLELTTPKLCYSSVNPSGNFNGATCTQAASGTYSAYSANLTGLTANTTYYFQQIGTVGSTIYYGAVLTFTTNSASASAPTPVTVDASSKTQTTATLNGTMNAGGAETTVTFEYCLAAVTTCDGTNISTPIIATASNVTGTSPVNVSSGITGLSPNSTYWFRVKGVNSVASVYGGFLSFVTTALTPWSITASSANYTIGGSVPTLSGTASPSGGLSGSLTCLVYASSDTGYVTALTINSSLAAGTYVIRCTGSTASGYATPTITNSTLTVTATPPTTFSVTINSATGGTGSTSNATVNSGGSVTLTATASSGYTFSGWTCTGGGTLNSSTANPATLSNITANATCTPNFTANAAPINNSPGRSSGVKILVQKAPARNNTSGGNQGGSGSTAPTTTTTTTTSGGTTTTTTTTGSNSNASATGQTNSNGGVLVVLTNTTATTTESSNGAGVNAVNTTSTTQMLIDTSVPASVSVNRGDDNKIKVQAVNGWTGRISVSVVDENDVNNVESFVEVVINPLPVTNVVVTLAPEERKQAIKFDPSPSQIVEYQVQVNGKTVCEGTSTSCNPGVLIGPKTKVELVTVGNDDTRTSVVLAPFTPPQPVPALTVYFNVGSAKLTRAEIRKLDQFIKEVKSAGFTRVNLEGHTDVQGATTGYNNLALSNSRARQTAAYLSRELKVRFSRDQFAEKRPAVVGTGEPVFKNNRRTEVSVW